jgi:hypothetical protein
MGILSKLFKSDEFSTKNTKIIDAFKILQNSSLSNNERIDALAKLKSIFLTSSEKDDLKAISQTILKTVIHDESIEIRESALKTFDVIIENCLFFYTQSPPHADSQLRLSIVSKDAVPILIGVAMYKSEKAKELRLMAFRTLSKIAPFAIDDKRIEFFARSLNDQDNNIKMAVICTFENVVKSSNAALKSRIARFSLSALCKALDDPTIWVGATRVIGEMGKYALGAAPFLYKRLGDEDGEWAARALRNITGETYGKDEKDKWERWLQKSIVEKE